MVIKDTLLRPGWSYGNGDDQYDSDSLGSTKDVFRLKKSVKNSKKNSKNKNIQKMYIKDKKEHTDDQGWTTIASTSNRKPKTKTSQQSNIDSIIASINLDFKPVLKGAPEANIDSPIRENRCNIPEGIEQTKAMEHKGKYHMKQRSTTKTTAAEGEETTDQNETKKSDEHESNKQRTTQDNHSKDKGRMNKEKGEERNMQTAATTVEVKECKEPEKTNLVANGQPDNIQIEMNEDTDETSNKESQKNNNKPADKNKDTNKNSEDESNKNNNNGGGSKTRVNIVLPGDMDTYAFTISWRPDQKVGQDGKIIIKMLMREMVHRTPSIIFHPTNSASSPVPRDINNINNDFPTTPASFDDFFDVMRNRDNTNQRTFMKVTMPHNEKVLQTKLSNYLFYNKLYMNSPFIDDNTLEHVGFIENGHSRLVYRPNLEMKIKKGLKEVMESELLTPQQTAQLKHLSSPIRVECQRGTIRAGPNNNQIVCEGIVLKTAKSQAKIAMELLSMLPETLLGEHYRIMPKSLGSLLGYELYGQIVADTVNFQDKLRPITIMHCHPSVFEDMYDNVKVQNSKHVEVHRFITECCGAVSIEETSETKQKGKYIVVVPEEKVESARIAIGKMFQEFQQNDGRPTALACLKAYQNYPLVNDNVTISGHAQKLSEKIRNRYRNKPKTPVKQQSSSASYSYHGSTAAIHDQQAVPAQVPTGLRSIVRNSRRSNADINVPPQWPASPVIQQRQQRQQQQTQATNQVEDRTVMSNLSPDDSAKTMMTNVSRMVETLGSAVNTLARESANTNDTMKQMMMQQTATMNNLMLIMTRNEERREVPTSVSQLTSTPTNSTITNSQNSMSQYSHNGNKRKTIGGTTEDEITAASTVEQHDPYEAEDDVEQMLEEQEEVVAELESQENNEDNSNNDITMTDEEQTKNTPNVAGDFDTQFKSNKNSNDIPNSSPGTNRQ
jgi:hypothetical protein